MNSENLNGGVSFGREIPGFGSAVRLVFLLTVRQLLARKKLIYLCVLVALPSFAAIVMKTQGVGITEFWHALAPMAFLVFLTPIIALFFGGSVFGDDVDQKTIGYLLIRPISRDALFIGKTVGVTLITFGLVIFSAIAAYLPSVYAGSIASLVDQRHLKEFAGLAAVLFCASLIYSIFFTVLGLRFRHVMITGILYFVIVEIGFMALPGPPAMLSMSHHLGRLLPRAFATVEVLQEEEIFRRQALQGVDPWGELGGLALFAALLLFVGIVSVRGNDFYENDDD